MKYKKRAGFFLITTVVTILISLIITLKFEITLNTYDIDKTLYQISKHNTAHFLELTFDVLSSISLITFATLLYLYSQKDKTLFISMIFFIVSGTIMVIHDMGNFAVTWVANTYSTSKPAETYALQASAFSLLLTAKWGVTLASLMLIPGNFLCIFSIEKNTKFIKWFGIFAGIAGLPALVLVWLGENYEPVSYGLWLPILLWQLTFGILLFRNKPLYPIDNEEVVV